MDSTEITIRDMLHEDIEICSDIYFKAIPDLAVIKERLNTTRYFSGFIENKDRYAICFLKGDAIIGFLTGFKIPYLYYEYTVYIDNITVDPNHQKKGYGSTAFKMFLDSLPRQTNKRLITEKSRPAYRMYDKLGFMDMECSLMESSPLKDAVKELKAKGIIKQG